jgi:hypothetical protein
VFNAKTHAAILGEFSWAIAHYKWCIAEWRHQANNPNEDGDSKRFYDFIVIPALEDCNRLRRELAETQTSIFNAPLPSDG